MMNRYLFFCIMLLILFSGSVFAGTITAGPGSLTGPGSTGSVQLTLDSVPNGLSGYIVSVYPENPQIATISGATFPAWATLSEVSPGSGAAFTLKALDLNESISTGAKDIPLATLNLNGIASGSTRIMVESRQVDDDLGEAIEVLVSPGSVTVGGSGSVGQVIDLNLQSGWNLIGIPMTLQSGANTAEIFKDVRSEGHSIFTYTDSDGWNTIGRTEILNAMSAYWIYTVQPVKITLKGQGPATSPRSLSAGWSIVAIPATIPLSAVQALSSVSEWTYVIGFDASLQKYEQPIINGGSDQNSDQTQLKPAAGYWIYLSVPGQISP